VLLLPIEGVAAALILVMKGLFNAGVLMVIDGAAVVLNMSLGAIAVLEDGGAYPGRRDPTHCSSKRVWST